MGAGRKTESVALQKKPPPQWNSNTNPYSARNLNKKDLAGVIFGCKHSTYKECMSKKLFGLPAPHFQYVKNVTQGMTLFLFNYTARKLHGIFEAISTGQMKIDPHAWTEDEEETPFPAQVRVKVRMLCVPLTEDQFQPVLAKNYRPHDPNFFWFELDASQNEKLISLLSASPVRPSVSALHSAPKKLPYAASAAHANCSSMMTRLDLHSRSSVGNDKGKQKWEAGLVQDASDKNGKGANSLQGRTWSSLFKPKFDSISKQENTNSGKPPLEMQIPCQNHFSILSEHSCSELSPEGEKESVEVLASKGITKEVVEQVSSSVPNSEFSDFIDTGDAMPSLTKIFDQIALAADMLDDGEDTENIVSNGYPSFPSQMEWPSSLSVLHLDSQIEMVEAPLNEMNYEEGHMTSRPRTEGSNYSAMSGIVDMEDNAADDAYVLREANAHGMCFPEGIISELETADLRTVVIKLIETIGEMKSLQSIQSKSIQKLEEELAESNRQIEELRYHVGTSALPLSSVSPGHGKETKLQGCLQDSNQHILLVGGFDGFSWLPDLDSYLPSKDVIRSLEPMSSVRSYVSAVVLDYELYVLGGGCENSWYNTVERYNLKDNRWVSCPSLNSRKGSLAGVNLGDKIFAIGGGNAAGCLPEVEVLDPNIGKWIFTCSMMHKRFAPAAAQMNGVLYAVGGYDGQEYLRSMERLDPRECTWTRLQNMTTRRGCHSLAVLNEKLYAVGGFDGYQMVPTVEVFEPRVGSWMMSEPMKCARGYMGTVALGNNILVIGGTREDNEVLDTVECYSEGQGWQLTDLKSAGKRCFFSAVV